MTSLSRGWFFVFGKMISGIDARLLRGGNFWSLAKGRTMTAIHCRRLPSDSVSQLTPCLCL